MLIQNRKMGRIGGKNQTNKNKPYLPPCALVPDDLRFLVSGPDTQEMPAQPITGHSSDPTQPVVVWADILCVSSSDTRKQKSVGNQAGPEQQRPVVSKAGFILYIFSPPGLPILN